MFGKTTRPRKSYRDGFKLFQGARIFCDEDSTQEWIGSKRWRNGRTCPVCVIREVSELKKTRLATPVAMQGP